MQAREIARLIMVAMNHDCCRYFAGPHHTLEDFEDLMTALCEREDSQYSYRNTLVAIDEEGVTAAAYTVMMTCGAARPPEDEIDFTLDRPFLFLVTSQDNLPLFTGVVEQP